MTNDLDRKEKDMKGKGDSLNDKNHLLYYWLRTKFDGDITEKELDPSKLKEVPLESDTKDSEALVLARAEAEAEAEKYVGNGSQSPSK